MDIVAGTRIMELHFDSDDDLAISISSTRQNTHVDMFLDEEKALLIAKLILKKYNITKIKQTKSIELS